MKTHRWYLAMIAFVTLSCTPEAVKPVAHDRCGSAVPEREDAIREVVLRRLMDANGWMYPKYATVYFIGVGDMSDPLMASFGWDPTDELINKFTGHVPPVKPLSAATFQRPGVADSESGRPGAIISTRGVCWLSATEVEVEAMRWLGPTGGQGYVYRLAFKHGKWAVASEEITWVS